MISLLKDLLSEKRYRAIKIISNFFRGKINELLFMLCLELKDLDALKELNIKIEEDFFSNDRWVKLQEYICKYCNEEYLGADMMNYILTHKVKQTFD